MPLRRLSTAAPGSHSLGGMRYWITFYDPGQPGYDGGAAPDSPAFSTWADIRALHGEELDKAQQIAQEIDHLIGIPYQIGPNENQIIGFQGRKFQIKYIEDSDESRMFLDVYACEIGQNAGQDTSTAAPPPPGAPGPAPSAPSSGPGGLVWTLYNANAGVPPGALVGVKADGGADGITLTLEGQEGELLYAAGVGTLGGLVSFVDAGGALFDTESSYDLNNNQTVLLAFTGGKWWVYD